MEHLVCVIRTTVVALPWLSDARQRENVVLRVLPQHEIVHSATASDSGAVGGGGVPGLVGRSVCWFVDVEVVSGCCAWAHDTSPVGRVCISIFEEQVFAREEAARSMITPAAWLLIVAMARLRCAHVGS